MILNILLKIIAVGSFETILKKPMWVEPWCVFNVAGREQESVCRGRCNIPEQKIGSLSAEA